MNICLPIKINLKTNKNINGPIGTTIVNIFFAFRLKEVNLKRYGDEVHVLPAGNMNGVYRYSDSMLKHIYA